MIVSKGNVTLCDDYSMLLHAVAIDFDGALQKQILFRGLM